MASVEGKDTKFTDLKKGTKLDLYIEHSKWGLYASPDGKSLTILSRESLYDTAGAAQTSRPPAAGRSHSFGCSG